MNVWLIGAGPMALDYFRVLTALGADVTVIGRGRVSASIFEAATGQIVVVGGLERFLESSPRAPDAAIVSVGVPELAETTKQLIQSGVRKVLVEKPGALTIDELRAVDLSARRTGAEVIIAYNRRCYASTLWAKQMIKEDGGVQSCHFEFTEWPHVIEALDTPARIKERWLIANSSHVVDLAFHLCGAPVEMDCSLGGKLPWHSSASKFAGAGVTERGVLFSYQANWSAPGRWGLEVLTAKNRLIFRPLEALQVVRARSVVVEPVAIEDALDKTYKPGLHEQVRRFLGGRYEGLCTVAEQLRHWPHYCRMAGYPSGTR
jgi:predicted dehydrogenase